MSDIVSEIKSRLNIEDVVAQYVHLKKSGRNLKGLCPFHHEKTPSFMVSPEKQLAYCFGCHKGGDLIAFIQEIEGLDFKEAVKLLAEKSGIDPAEYKFSEKAKYTKTEKDELFDIHRNASSFYTDRLWNSEDGFKVLEYLRGRGLKDGIIKEFKMGLSPDSFDETHLYLVKKGFSRKMISLSGIAVSKDTESQKVYDRFRARLIIPIYDSLGRIVGFGGRALKKDDEPKYLNSPDSPIYRKSEILYGYNFAKDYIKKSENALLVEGYFDVIMSHQTGVKNVVASSGTALSQQQIKLLKRLTKELDFCFDNDQAGIDAAKRGFELAQKEGLNVNMITIPGAKDPADYIKENNKKWNEIIKNKVPFMEFCINDVVKKYDPSSLEGKKNILNELIQFLILINSSLERDFYIREIAQKIDAKEVQIYDEIKKIKEKRYSSTQNISKKDNEKGKKLCIFELIIGLFYEYPDLLENYLEEVKIEHLKDDEKSIYKTFKDHYNLLRAENSKEEFLSYLKEEFRRRLELISLFIEEAYGTFNDEMIENELKILLNKEKNTINERQKRSLTKEIREAEKSGNKKLAKTLLEKLQNLVRH